MKLIAVYIGGLVSLLLGGAGFVFNDQVDHEAAFDDATLCEARGGAWVHDASVPLCMTPDEGLLELIDGSFVAFTGADPWIQTNVLPLEGKELAMGDDGFPDATPQRAQVIACTEERMEVYDGRTANVDFSSWPEAAKYKTAITKDVRRGVNFAGSYVVSTWGCGRRKSDACVGHAIVHARTGEIVLYDVIGHRAGEFSLESNLFSVTQKNGEEKKWSVEGDALISCQND